MLQSYCEVSNRKFPRTKRHEGKYSLHDVLNPFILVDYHQQCAWPGQPAEGGRGHLGADEAVSGAAAPPMGQLSAGEGLNSPIREKVKLKDGEKVSVCVCVCV